MQLDTNVEIFPQKFNNFQLPKLKFKRKAFSTNG